MTAEDVPLGGLRMVLALSDLSPSETAELAADYVAAVTERVPWHMLETEREFLFSALCKSALRGEVEFRAVPAGARAAEPLHGSILLGSRPNFLADTLEAAGTIYHAVRVFPASGSIATTTAGGRKGIGGPKPKGEDSFIAEMVRFALLDPCETRAHMMLHMQEWNGSLPEEDQVSQSTIDRRLARWWPAGID